jgi:hypothetical protein
VKPRERHDRARVAGGRLQRRGARERAARLLAQGARRDARAAVQHEHVRIIRVPLPCLSRARERGAPRGRVPARLRGGRERLDNADAREAAAAVGERASEGGGGRPVLAALQQGDALRARACVLAALSSCKCVCVLCVRWGYQHAINQSSTAIASA